MIRAKKLNQENKQLEDIQKQIAGKNEILWPFGFKPKHQVEEQTIKGLESWIKD